MKIINLTLHPATPEQAAAGVIDFPPEQRERLVEILTFRAPPSWLEMDDRAYELGKMVAATFARDMDATAVMLDGPAFFSGALEREFSGRGYELLYPFFCWEMTARTIGGETCKTPVNKHRGFVEVYGGPVKR